MKSKRIERLFYSLADLAACKGMEFSLELQDYESQSKVLNGAFGNSSSRGNDLILRAWWPLPDGYSLEDKSDGGN